MAKKLLEERTVRRWAKIAGIATLNENLDEMDDEGGENPMEEAYSEGEEEDPDEMGGEEAEEDPMEPAEKPEEEGGDEEVDLDLVDDEMGGSMGEDEKVELLQKLAQALGIDVEVEGEESEMDMKEPEPAADMEEPEADEEPLEEGEHMEEPAKDPAGHSLEKPATVDDADSKDPNQAPKMKEQDPMKAGPHMMSEAFKKKLVEQVAKRVSARLKTLK